MAGSLKASCGLGTPRTTPVNGSSGRIALPFLFFFRFSLVDGRILGQGYESRGVEVAVLGGG